MKLLHRFKDKKGYTLLELLVVIAIIAIIATVGLVSFNGTQKKARDTRRRGDLRTIANALEQYYAVCGSVYPTPPGGVATAIYTTISCPNPATTIMTTVPKDPTGSSYTCTGCSATTYQIGTAGWEAEPTPYPSFTNQQ
ncbi:prepilin-type N-terminal cleavage/methylation domain-containing protein [Candidatus Microgenomates bacterium]|nr:prepilin-type N-terminal cleavage/methylation domain-containing protein [Candidatus Microgenomates bacterium]